jgi:hypothetical protein
MFATMRDLIGFLSPDDDTTEDEAEWLKGSPAEAIIAFRQKQKERKEKTQRMRQLEKDRLLRKSQEATPPSAPE